MRRFLPAGLLLAICGALPISSLGDSPDDQFVDRLLQSLRAAISPVSGFFQAGESYYGRHGYSLRLDGLEPGINDLARQRAIVIHGADYVNEDWVSKYGRIGRSHGCTVPVS